MSSPRFSCIPICSSSGQLATNHISTTETVHFTLINYIFLFFCCVRDYLKAGNLSYLHFYSRHLAQLMAHEKTPSVYWNEESLKQILCQSFIEIAQERIVRDEKTKLFPSPFSDLILIRLVPTQLLQIWLAQIIPSYGPHQLFKQMQRRTKAEMRKA